MKGYSQMTPAERAAFIAAQIDQCEREIAQLREEAANNFRAEGVPEPEIAAKVEAYFSCAEDLGDGPPVTPQMILDAVAEGPIGRTLQMTDETTEDEILAWLREV